MPCRQGEVRRKSGQQPRFIIGRSGDEHLSSYLRAHTGLPHVALIVLAMVAMTFAPGFAKASTW